MTPVKRFFLAGAAFAAFFVAVFSPVIFTGKLMASGDAIIEGLPAYLGPHHLWEPLILLGYPLYANPVSMSWYPVAWLRAIPGTYNVYAILPFWIAALGTFGLVRALTRSSFAGAIAGIVFSLGGFMISHAGHLMILHPVAWAPWTIWSLEELRRSERRGWFAMLAGSIGLSAFGQPQVAAFTLGVAALYAAASAFGAPHRLRYLGSALAAIVLGIALAAVALVPQAVLASMSVRAAMSFGGFIAFSLTPSQLAPALVFPYAPALAPNFAEDTLFAGTGAVMLAIVALLSRVPDRRVWFWAAIAVGGLALSTGNALGLANLTYHIPVYDLFRIPGRHALEFTLAMAVLAGYGVAALERNGGEILRNVVRAVLAIGIAGAGLALAAPGAIGVAFLPSLCTVAACAAILVLWSLRPQSRVLAVLMIAAVAAEMVTFAERAYWRTDAIDASVISPPAIARDLVRRLGASGSRALWTPGVTGSRGFAPNLSLLWNVPVATGYTQLAIARVSELLGLAPDETMPYDGALDIAGVRYVGAPAIEGNLGVYIGGKGETRTSRVVLGTPKPMRADRIVLLSALGDSVAIPQDAAVARVRVRGTDGREHPYDLLAGRDTAEASYDLPDVRAIVKHRRATVAPPAGGFYHLYVASLPTGVTAPVDRVTIDWIYPGHGALSLVTASLIDDRTGAASPLTHFYGERSRFHVIATADGATLFENLQAYPHAWTVRGLEHATPDEAAVAAPRGIAPDGSTFDAREAAFVDGASVAGLGEGTVDSTIYPDGRVRMHASCSSRCFVVTGDAWYPFWHASVDGGAVPVERVDGALRGLFVPAGRHEIDEWFAPLDLLIGAVTSILALVAIVLVELWGASKG